MELCSNQNDFILYNIHRNFLEPVDYHSYSFLLGPLQTGIFLYFLYHVDHIAYRIAKEHTKNGVCILPCRFVLMELVPHFQKFIDTKRPIIDQENCGLRIDIIFWYLFST